MNTNTNRFRTRFLIFVFVVFAASFVGINYVKSTEAAPGKVKTTSGPSFGLYVNPYAGNIKLGSQLKVKVYANFSSVPVQSISAMIKYDPKVLRLDTANQDGSPQTAMLCSGATNDKCRKPGDIVLGLFKSGDQSFPPSKNVLMGNLTFMAIKTGNASITFNSNPKLSGFGSSSISQTELDKRTLVNGNFKIVIKGKRP